MLPLSESPTCFRQFMAFTLPLAAAIGGWALSTVCAAQDPRIPEERLSRVLEKATGRELEVTILWGGPMQIRVRHAGRMAMWKREEFEILYWEGVTNAEEILAGCEAVFRQVVQAAARVELEGETAVERLEQKMDDVQQGLARISEQAGRPYQHARELSTELDGISVNDLLHRHAFIQKVLLHMHPLAKALELEQYEQLPRVCEEIKRRVSEIDTRRPEAAAAVLDRLYPTLQALEATAPRFKRLPETALPAEMNAIRQLLGDAIRHYQALQSIPGTHWLGADVEQWFERQRQETTRIASRLRDAYQLTRELANAASELASLEASLNNAQLADLPAIEERFREIEMKLAEEEGRLRSATSEAVPYALEHLERLRNTLQTHRLQAPLTVREGTLQALLSQLAEATTPEQTRQQETELTELLERVQRLSAESYAPGEQLRIQHLLTQTRSARLQAVVQAASLDVARLQDQMERSFAVSGLTRLAANRARHQEWRNRIARLRQELAETIEDHRDLPEPPAYRIAREQLQTAQRRLDDAATLIGLQQEFAALPATSASLHEWELHTATFRSLHNRADEIRAASPSAFDRHVNELLAAILQAQDARQQDRPRLEFEAAEQELQRHFGELAAGLEEGCLRASRLAFADTLKNLTRLEELLDLHPLSTIGADAREQLTRERARHQEFAEALDALLVRLRRKAEWRPLPPTNQPLFPPTPRELSRLISILLEEARFTEAQKEMDYLRTLAQEPLAHTRASQLQMRLDYRMAVDLEEAGEWEQASAMYHALETNAGCRRLAGAAGSALRRIDVRRERESRERRVVLHTGLLASVLGLGLLGGITLVWSNCPRQRLRLAQKRIAAARRAALRGDLAQRDRWLRAVAELLAEFPDGHPQASRLRDQLRLPDMTPNAVAMPHARVFPLIELDQACQAALKSKKMQDVPLCLAWLRKHAAEHDSPRYQQVLQWLAERLEPAPTMLPEQLKCHAGYAAALAELVPKLSWPALYQVAACWWLGDLTDAQLVLKTLAPLATQIQGADQLLLPLALAWWKKGSTTAAVQVLTRLQNETGSGQLRRQAKRWLTIIHGQPTTRKGRSPSKRTQVVASLLGTDAQPE